MSLEEGQQQQQEEQQQPGEGQQQQQAGQAEVPPPPPPAPQQQQQLEQHLGFLTALQALNAPGERMAATYAEFSSGMAAVSQRLQHQQASAEAQGLQPLAVAVQQRLMFAAELKQGLSTMFSGKMLRASASADAELPELQIAQAQSWDTLHHVYNAAAAHMQQLVAAGPELGSVRDLATAFQEVSFLMHNTVAERWVRQLWLTNYIGVLPCLRGLMAAAEKAEQLGSAQQQTGGQPAQQVQQQQQHEVVPQQQDDAAQQQQQQQQQRQQLQEVDRQLQDALRSVSAFAAQAELRTGWVQQVQQLFEALQQLWLSGADEQQLESFAQQLALHMAHGSEVDNTMFEEIQQLAATVTAYQNSDSLPSKMVTGPTCNYSLSLKHGAAHDGCCSGAAGQRGWGSGCSRCFAGSACKCSCSCSGRCVCCAAAAAATAV
jgi:hypothetical protein